MAAAPRALRISSRGLSALFRQNKCVSAPFSSAAFAQTRLLQTRQATSTFHAAFRLSTIRWYAEGAGMTEADLTNRVINVVKMFDKVTPDKVTAEAHFVKDLGLDSLDAVEIVMAFEDEFGVEISDEEAEKILSCQDAINLLKVKMDISSSS